MPSRFFCSHINEPVVVKGEQKRQIIIGDRERKYLLLQLTFETKDTRENTFFMMASSS
jgi:hypothetical protein